MKQIIGISPNSAVPDGTFISFLLKDGGRVNIPPAQVARLWNEEQKAKEDETLKVNNCATTVEYSVQYIPLLDPTPSELESFLNGVGRKGWSFCGNLNGMAVFGRLVGLSGTIPKGPDALPV